MEWGEKITEVVETFLSKSRLREMFGPMEQVQGKVQAGYTAGLTYINRPWYLMISWNDDMPNMGICVRFSAYAYAVYKQEFVQRYQADMNIAAFLQMVQDDLYMTRLSRIDLTADYKNYPDPLNSYAPLSPDSIYTRLKDGSYIVKNWRDRQAVRTMSGIDKDGAYETFYVGARTNKSNGYLRCYNKKLEQIQTNGFRYDEAIQCDSWVRFEAVFLHSYAHQITDQLFKTATVQELKRLIAKYISDRYQFYDTATEEVTEFTDDLIGIATGAKAATLTMESPRDNDLRQSIEHLRKGSGLYATLYKAFLVWGSGADRRLLEYLYRDYTKDYKRKLLAGKDRYRGKEMRIWFQKHYAETVKYTLEDYLKKILQ